MQFVKPWEGPVTPEGISAARDAAARNAAGLVCEGMTLGLGTGDTAERWIRLVAERKHKHLKCVATSQRSAKLAESLGLALVDLDEMLPRPPQKQGERSRAPIDLTVDGADEIDRWLQLSKGGGGALLREKLVAQASSQVIILVDETKCVDRIGQRRPLAIEVVRFGATQTLARIATLPQVKKASIRKAATDSESVQNPFVTDSGNVIVDADLDPGQTRGIAAFVLHESLTVTVSRLLSGKGMPQRRVLARLSVCGEPTVSQAAKDILAWHKKEARRKYEALKKIGVSPPKRLRLQFERLKP